MECDTYDLAPAAETSPWFHRVADRSPFALLDASATRDAAGRDVTVAVVNRDRDRPHTATVSVTDDARILLADVYEVNAPDPATTNSLEHPNAVGVAKATLAASGPSVVHTFPAHSFTMLRTTLE